MFEINALEFPKLQNFVSQLKCLNLEQKILYLSFKKLMSYLKSTTCNLSNCNVSSKINILKFGAKNTLFGCFGQQF